VRVAAVDIGTNTVLLLVAERSAGGLVPLVERATVTRLGEGVDRTRAFGAAAIERTLFCLEEYARTIEGARVDRVAVVGTSAMRDASGGDALRARVASLFGVEPVVLTGKEEARLTFLGALSGLPSLDGHEVGVFDIGGGSTEIVVGELHAAVPRIRYAQSFDIGSVRLTERFFSCDPPGREQIATVRQSIRECLRHVPPLGAPVWPIGVAGTMTTLAAVRLGLTPYDGARVHGVSLSTAELISTVDHLASIDVAARAVLPGMEPKRADVIVAGGILTVEVLTHWGASGAIVSDRGVRWGLAEELSQFRP
jgi:exopolyphosphatase/guanosine-5'-triphosphate,3'-diphosphate pyrophosphatase